MTLCRSQYVPPQYVEVDGRRAIVTGTGRSRQQRVGSFSFTVLRYDDVPSSVLDALTAKERTELADWFRAQAEERHRRRLAQAPERAVEGMTDLAEALEKGQTAMTENLADQVWEVWERLSRHLRSPAHQQKTSRNRRGLTAEEATA